MAGSGHEQFIAATDTVGEVAVYAASARDGLLVAAGGVGRGRHAAADIKKA